MIHYRTKNQEGRKTIDWSIGEQKTKFISVHGIKGKGHRVVILLGMSEKSIPMVEWLFKTEELVSQSVMNVALTRSERYLFVGVNSIPSRYIYDQFEPIISKKLAYCSWDSETYSDAPEFYKSLLTGFEQFERFDFVTDKYTRNITYTPSKSVLAIKEDIVQEHHISDCISNAYMLLSDDVMTKTKFGKRLYISNTFNIIERAILGVLAELLVQRYMRLYTGNLKYDNQFLWNYFSNNSKNYYYTNHQALLNIVFDTKLNNYVKNPTRWNATFSIVKQKCKHIKSLRETLSTINSPTYILDNTFEKMNITCLLENYFSTEPNEKLKTRIYWNLALFHSALSGHYKLNSVMMYTDSFNKPIDALHANTKNYCHNFLINQMTTHELYFQKEITIIKKISDPELLSIINPDILEKEDKEKVYRYGMMGISDIVQEERGTKSAILHEIKCISSSDSAKVKTWIFQSVLYGYLLKKLSEKTQNDISSIIIVNLLSGTIWRFDMTKILIRYRSMIEYIMQQKHFPQQLIDHFLN